ncbi:MAG: hypothetical protein SCARUB_04453 [Candidatus Scalindua rubra]|uniref:Uncharacterized protein n=1 Tax=Candidatus Scalindua rubra TaxID=1872076 RepID=A0A1E3X642_9BACT|nr:MAG: hypothetical protein SCARUB_04453 [Candidatus Scalindua rubra]
MAYGKITKFGIHRTNQYGSSYDEKAFFNRRSSCCPNGTIWSIQEAILQIYSRSVKGKTQITDTRKKNGLYSQTSYKFGFLYQRACKLYRRIDKCYSNTSAEGFFKEKGAWLKGIVRGRLKWFIVLTGWKKLRFHRYISYWFRRRSRLAEKIIQV